jgi:predicted MFS family arabinose efflux permease
MLFLLPLALGTFAIGTGSLMVTGLLPPIAADLGVGIPAGHLTTAFALAYAVASPLLAGLTGGMERRRLLLGAMLVFVAGCIATAMAPGYGGVLAARLLSAVAAATFVPAAGACAVALAPPGQQGRAMAAVIGGLTMAAVLGVPVGTLLGGQLGWRIAFALVAVPGLLCMLGCWLMLPQIPGGVAASLGQRLAVARRPEVLLMLAQTAMTLASAFCVMTFLSPFLRDMAGVPAEQLPLALLFFGLGGMVGTVLGGVMADRGRLRHLLLCTTALMGGGVLLLGLLGAGGGGVAPLLLLALGGWAACGWCFLPVQQARLVAVAPPLAPVLLSLNASANYLGTSIGAVVGSVAVAQGGLSWLAPCSALLAGCAWLLLAAPAPKPVPAAAESIGPCQDSVAAGNLRAMEQTVTNV